MFCFEDLLMIKLLIALVIIACIAPLFIKGPDGEPIMTLDDWKIELPASFDELVKRPEPELPAAEQKLPTTVYKWQDENGIWQFSNQPVEGENVEVMELDGKINTIPAVPIITQNPGGGAKQPATSSKPAIATIPSGLTSVSVEKIAEMMDAVNNLQETVDERKALMDKIVIGKN